jgi:prepilin-type processing-associated H-X9-DG protein
VIFDPDVYPVNFAFLDGRVSEEHYREEHELAYEERHKEAPEEQAGREDQEGEQAQEA